MRVLVTGVKGQLGNDIFEVLKKKYDIVGIDYSDLDISNKQKVAEFFIGNIFDIIIHCAAYTNVEQAEKEAIICFNINVDGTRYLVEQARKSNALFIYFSTDYVFDGKKPVNTRYNEEDVTNPINQYGLSKELGEQEVRSYTSHYILRISWIYGLNGNNFIKTMVNLANKNSQIFVISDQIGSPTYTRDIANNLEQFILSDKFGTYHFTNTGYTSWADYSRLIFELTGDNIVVEDIKSSDYKTMAIRPLNSQLSQKKLANFGFKRLPFWKDAVKRYLTELGENK